MVDVYLHAVSMVMLGPYVPKKYDTWVDHYISPTQVRQNARAGLLLHPSTPQSGRAKAVHGRQSVGWRVVGTSHQHRVRHGLIFKDTHGQRSKGEGRTFYFTPSTPQSGPTEAGDGRKRLEMEICVPSRPLAPLASGVLSHAALGLSPRRMPLHPPAPLHLAPIPIISLFRNVKVFYLICEGGHDLCP